MLDEKAWRRDETYRIEVPSLVTDDPGFQRPHPRPIGRFSMGTRLPRYT